MRTGLKKLGVLLGIMALVTAVGILITWGVSLSSKRGSSRSQEPQDKFRVVTSFYPMYIAAMNIVAGIDGVELANLTENKGGCLHDYQLTSADMRKLENADVLIINGGGMEAFLGRITEAYPDLPVIDASIGIEGIADIADIEGIGAGGENAHYWMEPEKYKEQLANIAAGLSALDAAHQGSYESNCKAYEMQVEALEETMRSTAEEFPKEKAVLFHNAFEYLAKWLGIEVIYSVELEEDTSLNTGEIAEIVDKAKEEGVRLLFTEKQFRDSIPLGISRETGASLCVVDTLVSGPMEREAYLEGMEQNMEEISHILQGLD